MGGQTPVPTEKGAKGSVPAGGGDLKWALVGELERPLVSEEPKAKGTCEEKMRVAACKRDSGKPEV